MTSEKQEQSEVPDTPQNEKSLLLELFFNLFLPTLLLIKGHVWLHLSPKIVLFVAIACPLTYGIWDWIKEAHFNWIAFLGLISVGVKGGVGLFEGSNQLLAINEMLLPLIIGCAIVVFRLLKKPPFLQKILLNNQFCYVEKIQSSINAHGYSQRLQRYIRVYEWLLAGLFFFSATLNYILARYLVIHPAGSKEFNKELGMLTWWGFVVISVPATIGLLLIVWRFFTKVKKFSQLSWEEILRN